MKEIQDMNRDELLQYFIEKKLKGLSFREIDNIFRKYEIDDETKKYIISKLDEIDKQQKVVLEKVESRSQKGKGVISLIIGLAIVAFGFILYFTTARAGVVFIFNFVVWGFGALMVLRGIVNILS